MRDAPGDGMPTEGRKYTESEVAEILEKAVEGDEFRELGRPHGMSLTELKAIGDEVGIDPRRIENAALALDLAPKTQTHPLVGSPTAFDYEARVPGEIPADRTPDVIALIRRITGKPGELSDLRGTLEWRTDGDIGSRWITVSPRDGHSIIRASSRLGQGAVISFVPTAVAAIASVVPVLNAPSADGNMMALILIPLVVALYAITRGLWSRYAGKEADQLQRVVEELSALAESFGEDP